MSRMIVRREAERKEGLRLAGPLAHLLDEVAERLHGSESLHLHDGSGHVTNCGYCYLRAGRTLGVVASSLTRTGGDVASSAPCASGGTE